MISSSTYLSVIARRLLQRAWWLPAAAVIVIACGVATDVRFVIVGLMMLFIIYPMIMSFTILKYATLKTLARRTLANKFDLDDDRLCISRIEVNEEDGTETITPIETCHISGLYHSGDRVIFEIGSNIPDIIIAPDDSVAPQLLLALESKIYD